MFRMKYVFFNTMCVLYILLLLCISVNDHKINALYQYQCHILQSLYTIYSYKIVMGNNQVWLFIWCFILLNKYRNARQFWIRLIFEKSLNSVEAQFKVLVSNLFRYYSLIFFFFCRFQVSHITDIRFIR